MGNARGMKEWMGKPRPSPRQSWGSTPRLHREKGSGVISTRSRTGSPVPSPARRRRSARALKPNCLATRDAQAPDRLLSPARPSTVLHDHRELSRTALRARGLEKPEVQRAWGRSGRAALFPAARGRGGEWGDRWGGRGAAGGDWQPLKPISSCGV